MTREESKRATKQALLEAGLDEITAHGLDAPSLDSICARAGYTRGAFYVHFKNREEFFVSVMEWVMGGMFDQIIGSGVDGADLEGTIQRFGDAISTDRWPVYGQRGRTLKAHQFMEAVSRSPRLASRYRELIQEAVARLCKAARAGQVEGTIREDADPTILAQTLMCVAAGAIQLNDAGVPMRANAIRELLLSLLRSSDSCSDSEVHTTR